MQVHIFTHSYTYTHIHDGSADKMTMHPRIEQHLAAYSSYYSLLKKPRALHWRPTLGVTKLNLSFDDGRKISVRLPNMIALSLSLALALAFSLSLSLSLLISLSLSLSLSRARARARSLSFSPSLSLSLSLSLFHSLS